MTNLNLKNSVSAEVSCILYNFDNLLNQINFTLSDIESWC